MTTSTRRKIIRFYRDESGDYRWRLHAANGRIIAGPQEGYRKRSTCESNALSVLGAESLTRVPDSNHGDVIGRDDVRAEWVS